MGILLLERVVASMFLIFFWIVIFLSLPGILWACRANWNYAPAPVMLWVAVVLLGLKVFPFHG